MPGALSSSKAALAIFKGGARTPWPGAKEPEAALVWDVEEILDPAAAQRAVQEQILIEQTARLSQIACSLFANPVH